VFDGREGEVRPGTVYGAGMALLAGWVVFTQAITLALHRASLVRTLSPAEDGIAYWARWGGRFTDVAVTSACMTVLPILAWVAVRWQWPLRGAVGPRRIALWIVMALCSWSAVLALWGPRKVWALPLLVWSGSLANVLVIWTSSAAQARLEAEGRSRVPASLVLYGGVLLQAIFVVPGFMAGLVPVLASWRDGRRRRTRG
jgi:hypothetical protein